MARLSDEAIRAAMSALWARSRETILGRVQVVENAALALLSGDLKDDARRHAEREAHKLAGAVGTFGYWEASTLARDAERILAGTNPIEPGDVVTLSNLAVQLRRQLELDASTGEAEAAPGEESPLPERARLLLITDDAQFAERLVVEARGLGAEVVFVRNVSAARAVLDSPVNAAVLDLAVGGGGIAFLEELHTTNPSLPVVVISGDDQFRDRVDAARLGGRGFLQKPVRPAQVIDVIRDVLVPRDELPTIVAIDDDTELLSLIEALLAPIGARIVKCNDPLRALNFLSEHSPDLVMLDVDMPNLNGIELCRVLRNDPRWASVPVLFLTARTETDNVMRMFEAGADDFVAKPVLGPELVARVRNRLERTRMLRLAADVDSLTGVATRRRGIEVLDRFFRVAQRQRQPISVAVIDLDHFKQVNDRYGHVVGDMVLRRVAAILSGCFRGEDIVARWGGEEFIVAMYSMPIEAAAKRLEIALQKLRDEPLDAGGSELRVTFSAGVAQFPDDGSDWATLYRIADEALGRAKAEGRNRVVRQDRRAEP
jgi:diguanylate cyclase (GGDEF)-like protein